MSSPQYYVMRLKRRTVTVRVGEFPDRIQVDIHLTPLSGQFTPQPGESAMIADMLLPIFTGYDQDPRPIVMPNPFTGETATIYGNAKQSLTVLESNPAATTTAS